MRTPPEMPPVQPPLDKASLLRTVMFPAKTTGPTGLNPTPSASSGRLDTFLCASLLVWNQESASNKSMAPVNQESVGVIHEGERHRLLSIPVKHRIACCGLRVEEHSLPWSLDGAKVKQANLPFHVRQALKRGESVEFGGQTLKPSMWGTAPRNPRSYVFSSDTRPCQSLLHAAQGASLMYHDATFCHADAGRAKATHHSTTIEAARLARQAGVKTLVLGHISLRYKDLEALKKEALQEHDQVLVAEDGMVCHV